MRLKVDGFIANKYPEPPFSIGDLLRMMDVETVPWLIISVNNKFYKREVFDQTFLNDGDEIELIYVRGGG